MLDALRETGWTQLLAVPARRRPAVGYLETEDFEARAGRDGGDATSTPAGRRTWREFFAERRARAPGGGLPPCLSAPTPRSTSAPTSGRVVLGRLDDGRVRARGGATASRTARCGCPDGLRWNLLALFAEALRGLCAAAGRASLTGIGVDTWGVDYALLDGRRPRARPAVPLPRRAHGRDGRGGARADRPRRAVRGHRHPDDADQHRLPAARRPRARRRWPPPSGSRSSPTCFNLWLTGELANESTERLDHRAARRAHRRVGARADRAPRPAGGAVRRRPGRARHRRSARARPPRGHRRRARPRGRPRTTPPRRSSPRRCATSTPRSCPRARGRCSGSSSTRRASTRAPPAQPHQRARRRRHDPAAQERDGPVAACRSAAAHWDEPSYDELHRARPRRRPPASRCSTPTTRPSSRPATCPRGSPPRAAPPARPRRTTRGEMVRSILDSLACKYRVVLERLEARQRPRRRRGPRDRRRLAQRAAVPADRRRARPPRCSPAPSRRPRSATCSCRRAPTGELGSLAEMREVAAASAAPARFEPGPDREAAEAIFHRFLTVTGAAAPARACLTRRSTRDRLRPPRRPPARRRPRPRRGRARARRARDRDARRGATATPAPASPPSSSPAARATSSSARRRRRGPPPHRHRARGRAALPVGRGRRPRRAARARSSRAGCAIGAVNPNLFQDPDYKLGSVTHPDAARARARPSSTCSSASTSPTALGSTAQSLWFADGTNYPGQDDLRERRRRHARRARRASTPRCPAEQELLVEYKFFEPAFYATDLADWGSRAARRARSSASARRCWSTSATTRRA